ncbi:short-chain dehydrogenase [[Bacillus] enclensis]|uniref:3-oxoacyl-[acyl-carrier protein] reductase n=1 Tax=[Bacillus] enclensis TaxID=1402860 RepID=A0A0V8HDH3_9BACI|nr:SDR family oxidoreductase [[Bacillus] enclensis]KSU60570.1 short-chain dehydrogenase [[Bacillus] enclensis]QTC40617.1 SDR family oxidoreductase [Bacillus sp. V3]SCC26287.1 3-oxoacyl-[acyl-carrier protein] reductase [[Bacillus] enclensis]
MNFPFHDKTLEGQHILITGATGGIGYAAAKAAVAAGARVTITGRNEEKLSELKQECGDGDVFAVRADLSKPQARDQLVEAAANEFGPITGLLNSAGIGGGDIVENLSEEDLRGIMELNYFSLVELTQLVYKGMKDKEKGSIVNIASLSGLRGTHGNSAYSASKFAVVGFTQAFALEAIEHGVRVNAVCPGYVDTEMGRNAIKSKGERNGRSYEEQLELAKESIPSGRLTSPEEVANTIVYLLSDAAENIVGESVKISGGSVMR